MKKFITMLLAASLAVCSVGALTACGKNEKIAALITLHGDNSSYDANFINAFKAACEAKGLSKKQYTIVSNIPEEGDDCYNKAAGFADEGYKVVFADSFGHEANMLKAAKEYKDTEFCHATGTTAHTENVANFHNAFASIYEGRYLAGVAAGLKLKEMGETKMGYVGAYPYAEVISGMTSFYLGAKSIVEDVTMEVSYTYSWYNETAEKNAALKLIANGAKLVSGHADSMGVPTACKEKSVPNVFYNGVNPNTDTFVIASKINWQPYFELMIDKALGNTASIPTDYTGTLATGSVQVTVLGGAAAAGTQAKLDEVKAKLESGELKVFDCSKFTVRNAKADTSAFSKAASITMDANGHLTQYKADVNTDAAYTPDTDVVENGIFLESNKRSAPYFDIVIDGITIGEDTKAEEE